MIEMGLKMEHMFFKPTMRSVFKGETAQVGFTVANVLVTRFINSFGFSTKLDPSQLEMITVDTLENFSYESLEDVILFFKMARSGHFGTTNRGVDSNLIFGEWFPKYLEKKADLREQNYQETKGQSKSEGLTYEDVKKTYAKINNNNMPKKVQAHVDHITKDFDRQMLEDLITDWEKDKQRKPWLRILKEKRKTIISQTNNTSYRKSDS